MTNGTGETLPGRPAARSSMALVVGAWLMPVTSHRAGSDPERSIQARAGIVGLVLAGSAVAGVATAAVWLALHLEAFERTWTPMAVSLTAAALLVGLSVFSPRPVFRTRSEAFTRDILRSPTAPTRPWRSTTITFSFVVVGALLAGIYFDPASMALMFGAAFTVRLVVLARVNADRDPNARYHALVQNWGAAAVAAAAFVIVRPLSGLVSLEGSIIPLVLAAVLSMYVGLAVSSLDRWVEQDRARWALLRDMVDTRRLIVALVSALVAWAVAVGSTRMGELLGDASGLGSLLAGLAIYLLALLVLWFVSIRMWVRESLRTLTLWAAHQSEVTARIADGSLSPELAARASLPVTARMALSVFGATRAMVVLDDGRGRTTTHLAAVDVYPHGPRPDARDLAEPGALRIALYPVPGHGNGSSVTVGRWLWAGWIMTRSRPIVGTFTDLATSALLTPVVSSHDDRDAAAFDLMFGQISRWPTMTAFAQAVERMQRRADTSPHTDSLVLGVLSIDEFGAIAGGRFEQAAVAQVMRLATGHQQLAGHDLFAAYEAPGRIWVALGGGPIIRNSIGLLRGLQEHINDHGAVPSAKLDIDVHVSVSLGYAAHQVDEFTADGLMAVALNRLGIDRGARDPFAIDDLVSYDIRPEDITRALETPVTAVDTLRLLQADARDAHTPETTFDTTFAPVVAAQGGEIAALLVRTGWRRTLGSMDLTDPDAFLALAGRQPQVAAEAARVALAAVKRAFAEAQAAGHPDLRLLVPLPAILLHPDAAEHALPNLVTPFLDRRECAHTVVLVDEVPTGAGQALRTLADRGVGVALTAGAAAGADPQDLVGWLRWAVVFPQHVVQGPAGIDGMTIQQTASAIATRGTRLIAVADDSADRRGLAEHSIAWTVSPTERWAAAAEALPTAASNSSGEG